MKSNGELIMLIRLILAGLFLLVPFTANSADTPVIDFGATGNNDDMLMRQCADENCEPDLVDDMDEVGEQIAICSHFNGTNFLNETDPSIIAQFDGVCSGNGFLRFHVDEAAGGTLRLRSGNGGGYTQISADGLIRENVWYKACARIEVLDATTGDDKLMYKLDYRADDETALEATYKEGLAPSHNLLHMTAFGLGKGIYDNGNNCYANVQVHEFIGQLAAWVVVRNVTDQDVADYLDGQDPLDIWTSGVDFILRPLMNASDPDYAEQEAEGGLGIDWFISKKNTATPLTASGVRTFTPSGATPGATTPMAPVLLRVTE
jgi:hypothetical protein